MKGSEFVVNSVHLLYYKCLKINLNYSRSYIDFPDWIKNKKAAVNSSKKDIANVFNMLSQSSNHEEIKKVLQVITNIKPFNWEGINSPSEKDNWKKFEKNNLVIAINVVYVKKKKYILLACYVSKHNSKIEKLVILFMVPNREKWHYLSKPSALFREIMSKHCGDFFCLNCLLLFRTKNKLELHKRVCENKVFCNIIPSEDFKILEFNQYQKSDKAPFIYADLGCLIEKIDGCLKIIHKIRSQQKI